MLENGMLVDESIDNFSDIMKMHQNGVAVYGVYFLCVSPQSRHVLEVIEAARLLDRYNSRRRYKIIGAASSRRQAFELVRQIVEGFVKTGRSIDSLKEYLLENRTDREDIMLRNKWVQSVLGCLFGVSMLANFLVASIFIPTFSMSFYSAEYDKYSIPDRISVPKEQLMEVTRHLTDYMLGREPDLVVYADVAGQNREFFNQREKAHMVDVKLLFDLARTVVYITVPLAICALLMCIGRPRKLASAFLWTQLAFLAILTVLVGLIAMDFDSAFITFHHIFFDNDLWELDYRVDLLINIVPLEFFIDISTRVAMIFSGFILGSMVLSGVYLRFSKPGKGS